jgi:hypothetical protein
MHAAIGLAMEMYLFAFVMIVLNVAAFGIGMSNERAASAGVPACGVTRQQRGISESPGLAALQLRG